MAEGLLADVPLFRGLAKQDLERLEKSLHHRRYQPDEVVFLRGDPGYYLCIIRSGRVRLTLTSEFHGREAALDLIGAGGVFGELALLDGQPRSADAVAVEPTELLLLDREDFLRFLREYPQVAIDLLADLSRRLRRDTLLIEDAAFLDVPARLARVILRLAAPQADGSLCTPRTTQTRLAELALTTRETLNKFLRQFSRLGLIHWENSRVFVLDEAGLRKRIY